MIDIALLKAQGVKSIRLELEFHVEQLSTDNKKPPLSTENDSTDVLIEALKKQEESLPVDLRADNLMNQDSILNWSSPDQSPSEPEMPLTGEGPL